MQWKEDILALVERGGIRFNSLPFWTVPTIRYSDIDIAVKNNLRLLEGKAFEHATIDSYLPRVDSRFYPTESVPNN